MHDACTYLWSDIDYAEMISRGDGGEPFRFAAMVIAAHPDDEVIGMGARLHRFTDVTFVHVTDGSPENLGDARRAGFATREAYSEAREAEWAAAIDEAGVRAPRHIDAGYIDQTASLYLPELIRVMTEIVAGSGAKVVFTHPYEGGHPDHDATALAVHATLALMRKRTASPPHLVEFTSYHSKDGRLAAFEFIPRGDYPPRTALLSKEDRRRKEAMLARFVSQREVLKNFPVLTESFRRAPRYDFTRPPHEGKLYYESFDWGMDRERWTERAIEALQEFSLECPL